MSSDTFEYPLGAIIAALLALSVAFLTIWATVKRERRDQRRELQAKNDELRNLLIEYIRIKLETIDVKINGLRRELKQMQFFIENSDINGDEENNSSP